jgi:glucose-6-phosphate isomerase
MTHKQTQHLSHQALQGISAQYEIYLSQTTAILKNIQATAVGDFLFSSFSKQDDLVEIIEIAEKIRNNFKTLLILGTGGSSLNGQIFTSFSDKKIDIQFISNIDPHSIEALLSNLKPQETAILSISKSGNTLETLAQTIVILDFFKKQNLPTLSAHFFFITKVQDNPLRQIAKSINACILNHEEVGGRFATFTNVALLPAAIAGLDIAKIRKGAQKALAIDNFSSARAAALHLACIFKGHNINVIMPYIDRLEALANWYLQIWAESLGKQQAGSTPIKAAGTIDQHSQLQLYLAGPRDKVFTIITHENLNALGPKINLANAELAFLAEKTIGSLMQATQEATIESFIAHGLALRHIVINKLDEETLGALAGEFILETVICANFRQINAFDQPAVEQGKIRTKELLINQHV